MRNGNTDRRLDIWILTGRRKMFYEKKSICSDRCTVDCNGVLYGDLCGKCSLSQRGKKEHSKQTAGAGEE